MGRSTMAVPAAAQADAAGGGQGGSGGESSSKSSGNADEVWKGVLKVSVYRPEKRNADNELVVEKGWKPVGRGQLRLLTSEGVHFLEFRPEVSEATGGGGEPEDEISSSRTRYGRAVISARIMHSTSFTVTKKSVQTKLWSKNAGGVDDYAAYNIPFPSEDKAQEFAAVASKCVPAS